MIADQLNAVLKTITDDATLIAVSKTKPVSAIQEAYDAGQRHFGENKVQEMEMKFEALPKDIHWHMIGHLQTNKVKYIAPFVHLIHSVDSLKLLQEINKQGEKNNRVIKCLLQFHIAEEETKFGLSLSEAVELLNTPEYAEMKNIEIVGVMGMASLTEDQNKIHDEFHFLKSLFDGLKNGYFAEQASFKEISMGMSGDYKIALLEGSTMVRVGSSIFGSR
jgi:pyridoxal phosphate enzyme (YggS family)